MRYLFCKKNYFVLILSVFITTKILSQGGPPMITDDPGTVDKGHIEINSGITAEHTFSESVYEFPFIDINYGVSERQHINFEVPIVSKYATSTETQRGIGKMGIGTKFRFIDQDKTGIDVSTHPALTFVLSTDAVDKGIVKNGTELFIPVAFQKDFGKNILGMELGRLLNTRSEGVWTYGLLYAREFTKRINAAAEINGSVNPSFTSTQVFLNLGTRINMTKTFTLLVSAGRSIIIPEDTERIFIAYLALQISF